METVRQTDDIITISHGIMDVANILRHKGRIQVADIDPGVRETTFYLAGLDGQPGDYPDLNILAPGGEILHTVQDYSRRFGVKKLGAVDVDLACYLQQAWEILRPVLYVLRLHGYQKRVFLTFYYGRADDFKSMEERIDWLKFRLRGTKVVRWETYQSKGVSSYAERSKGSHMCIVELQMGAKSKKKKTRKKQTLPALQELLKAA
jgi:hypothetical protein